MLTGIHFLLTYACTYECDHCFLYCGPWTEGTFTGERLGQAFAQIAAVESITNVYFEGGEPFLFYPLMVAGVRMARAAGLDAGIVTNCYWATSADDAKLWLEPFASIGLSDLSLSDDAFHHSEDTVSPAEYARTAARELGIPMGTICIEAPHVRDTTEDSSEKGAPIIGGDVRFRGRAVDKLTEGLPRRPADTFTSCPDEDLENPGRVHVDPFGNVHLCQGLCIGSMWKTPLAALLRSYDPATHPICSPLLRGGPAALARECGVDTEDGYVDACHLCYEVRRAVRERHPEYLTPPSVYGIT
ncbi:MAG TPA: hypothetical protein VM118_09090 [Acidobacteriota bacterium]|nr:hypothetical protein [Acidobacteriota bacterium]